MQQPPTVQNARYWRISALCAAGAAAAFGLLTWLITDNPVAPWGIGVLFGAMVGAYGGMATWVGESGLRARGYAIDTSPSVRQELDVTVQARPDELFEVCREVLRSLPDLNLETRDSGQLKLVGETGPSWRSFGEHVQIIVREIGPCRSRVWILSRPIHRPVVIDYGKNLENVVNIRDAIEVALIHSGKPHLTSAAQS